jgi:hypothetical protein
MRAKYPTSIPAVRPVALECLGSPDHARRPRLPRRPPPTHLGRSTVRLPGGMTSRCPSDNGPLRDGAVADRRSVNQEPDERLLIGNAPIGRVTGRKRVPGTLWPRQWRAVSARGAARPLSSRLGASTPAEADGVGRTSSASTRDLVNGRRRVSNGESYCMRQHRARAEELRPRAAPMIEGGTTT